VRWRTKILSGIALILVASNALLFFFNQPVEDHSGDVEAMWFGVTQEPMTLYLGENWQVTRRPMMIIERGRATRGGLSVPYTDMVDNIGFADYAAEREQCSVWCIQPWLAFARAGPSATVADIESAVRAVRARCSIEIVIFEGLSPNAIGRPVFLARGRDVPTFAVLNSEEHYLHDPTLLDYRAPESVEQYWDRTGCPTLNPRRP
jgi:hypothetical protein